MAVDRRPSAATVGVIGLAAVAVGLAYLALTSGGSSTGAVSSQVAVPTAVTSPSASPTPPLSSTPTTTAASSTTPAASAGVIAAELPLVVVSSDVAWRSTGGSCRSGDVSAVETTQDGGATWTRVTSPLAQVLSLTAAPGGGVTAAGYDATCTVRFRTTSDGGTSWPIDAAGGGAWTHAKRMVLSPAGGVTTPCGSSTVVSVEGAGGQTAYTLCADGTLHLTVDDGATQTLLATRAGAVALARGDDGTLYLAVRDAQGCSGTQIQASGDDGTVWTTAGCLAAATGRAAFDVAGTSAALIVGNLVFRSADRGVTWTALNP